MKKVAGIILVLVAWEIVSRRTGTPIFPPFSDVVVCFIDLIRSASFWRHVGASMTIIGSGFGIAAILGFTVGAILTQFRTLNEMLMPVVDAIRGIAALTIFPLLIVLLGIGVESKVFVICWTAWPAILLATMNGINQVDRSVIEAGRVFGAGRWRILLQIAVPLASQDIMTGLRIGLSGGWISLVSAEMLGSNRGLGYFVLESSQSFHFAEVYATIVMIALLGFVMNTVLWNVQKLIRI